MRIDVRDSSIVFVFVFCFFVFVGGDEKQINKYSLPCTEVKEEKEGKNII